MSSDTTFTATGPGVVGYLTAGLNLGHGARIQGTSGGVIGECLGTNGSGVLGQGAGIEPGVAGIGAATGPGVVGIGGGGPSNALPPTTDAVGVFGQGGAGNADGVLGQGSGGSSGVAGFGAATGTGVVGMGGTGAPGVRGIGGGGNNTSPPAGNCVGVYGQGGADNSNGVQGVGSGNSAGVAGFGGPNAGMGVLAQGGANGGVAIQAEGTVAHIRMILSVSVGTGNPNTAKIPGEPGDLLAVSKPPNPTLLDDTVASLWFNAGGATPWKQLF
jgi:hypothetical protein